MSQHERSQIARKVQISIRIPQIEGSKVAISKPAVMQTFIKTGNRHMAIEPAKKVALQDSSSLTFGALKCRILLNPAAFEVILHRKQQITSVFKCYASFETLQLNTGQQEQCLTRIMFTTNVVNAEWKQESGTLIEGLIDCSIN